MESVKNKYTNFRKCFLELRDIISDYRSEDDKERLYRVYLKAIIKQFELTYDACWKFLQEYLQESF